MSMLAKVFVIINLVLAVVFMAFCLTLYSKRVHYYDERVLLERKLTAEIKQRDQEIAKLNTEKQDLEKAKMAAETNMKTAQNENAQLATRLTEVNNDKAEVEKKYTVVTEQNRVLIDQVQKLGQDLEARNKDLVALQEKCAKYKDDSEEYHKEMVKLQSDLSKVNNDLQVVHGERKILAEKVATLEFAVKDAVEKYGYKPGGLLTAEVRTKVVDVKAPLGLAALGAGRKHGVKEGLVFLIHRGEEYIGKVQVTKVQEEMSGARILDSKKPIMAGDDAMVFPG